MNRKGRKGPQMQNPLAGMMDVPGGIPAGGFLGIGNPNGAQINFNNDELEDELADLLGKFVVKKYFYKIFIAEDNPKPVKKPAAAPKKGPVPWDQLDSMINNCMEDIGDDEEDIDDPDLENELEGMLDDGASEDSSQSISNTPSMTETPPSSNGGVLSILQQRVSEYQKAVDMSTGSKKKRMERQHKAVVQLLKKAQSGSTVKEDEIPSPPAGIGLNTKPAAESESVQPSEPAASSSSSSVTAPPVPIRSESNTKVLPPVPPPSNESSQVSESKAETFNNEKLEYLQIRLVEYKSAALEAKKNNDKKSAVSHFQNMKKIQNAIDNKDASFSIDSPVINQAESVEAKPDPAPKSPTQQAQPKPQAAAPVVSPMGQPKTAMEALLMRKTIFYEQEQKAKKENNSSKARRYGRIIKQYDAAIKLLKGGGKPDFDSLPDLPMDGFPQIPGVQAKELTLEDAMATANKAGNVEEDDSPKPAPKPAPRPAPSSGSVSPPKAKSEMPHLPGALEAGSDGSSAYGKQLEFLNQRHQQFRQAALKEKEKGNKEGAMKYLRCMKGMEPMIQNAKRGLPVDIRKIPPPPDFADTPKVEFGKEQLQRQDSSGTATRILNDLSNQVKKARSLSTQFTQLGNIEKAALMEKWATQSQRDMDIINMCLKRGERLPKIIYERRNIQLIKKYSDLRYFIAIEIPSGIYIFLEITNVKLQCIEFYLYQGNMLVIIALF